jgi:hypothetical protein
MSLGSLKTLPEYKQVCEHINPVYADIIFSYLAEIRYYNIIGEIRLVFPILNIGPKFSKIHGIAKKYYESGQIWSETSYINDKMYGFYKEYYEDGDIKVETPYINNKKHGIEKKYKIILRYKKIPIFPIYENYLDDIIEENVYFYGYLISLPGLKNFFLYFKDYIF